MANPSELDRIRSAIEALNAGDIEYAEFDRVVASVVAAGSMTRDDVRHEMEVAMVEDRSRPDPQHFTRPELRAAPATVLRNTRAPAPQAARHSTDTVMRPATGSPPTSSPSEPFLTDTESNWVDPDAVPSGSYVTVGQMLGRRYLLERVLGRGGMGVVYLATDQEVKGESFAIKLLKPEFREHPDSLNLLREEVRKARGLHHPNIAGVYSLNSDRSGIYMLMEFLEGKTVSSLIDEEFGRGMPLMRAWPLIKDVGAALAYAHDHSVIHSDIKPSNVFVTTSAKAKLLDFGVARAARGRDNRFDPNSMGGLTPAYASCEMLEGRPPDQSDDVYSFACVIYEMLSGKHPYNHISTLEARAAGLRPAPLEALNRSQNEALARALAYERPKRTKSVEGLLAELEGRGSRRIGRGFYKALGVFAGVAALAVAAWFLAPVALSVYRSSSFAQPHESATPVALAPPAAVAPAAGVPPAAGVAPPVAADATTPVPQYPENTDSVPEPPPVSEPAPVPPSAVVAVPPQTQESPSPAESSAAPLPKPVAAVARSEDPDAPPANRKVFPRLHLAVGSEAFSDECPYPKNALAHGDTGQVGLLAYVSPDGNVLNTAIESSSGNEELDLAAQNCVKDKGHYLPKFAGGQKVGYWGRTTFNWTFEGS